MKEHVVASTSTDSTDSMDHISRWLGRCLLQHADCNAYNKSEQWYPTRLLDLNIDCNTIKLVISKEALDLHGPYATLSHCWGETVPLRLTIKSLAAFQTGIPWSSIPSTFRHAVEVTRRLGVRYLWIDSLCIIQDGDNLNDWTHESRLMCEVYSNCLFNLSALVGKDSYEGLFATRMPHHVQPHFFREKTSEDDRSTENTYRLFDLNAWVDQIEMSHLSTRAWYVQERLLSPRIIYFGSQQVLWECRESRAMESSPEGGAFWATYSKTVDPLLEAEGGKDAWEVVVPIYSRALLTRPEDKAMAIYGLANLVEERTGDQYFAGLWIKDLVKQLLWRVSLDATPNGRPLARPKTHRAPTFSWLSVDSAVIMTLNHLDPTFVAEVVEFDADETTAQSTGISTGQFIRLKGFLKRALLNADNSTTLGRRWYITLANGNGEDRVAQLDDEAEMVHKKQEVVAGKQQSNFLSVILDVECPYCRPEPVYCIVLAIGEEEGRLDGLVLEAAENQGLFRRIGYFRGFPGAESELLHPSSDQGDLPCDEFEPITSKHTIRII